MLSAMRPEVFGTQNTMMDRKYFESYASGKEPGSKCRLPHGTICVREHREGRQSSDCRGGKGGQVQRVWENALFSKLFCLDCGSGC